MHDLHQREPTISRDIARIENRAFSECYCAWQKLNVFDERHAEEILAVMLSRWTNCNLHVTEAPAGLVLGTSPLFVVDSHDRPYLDRSPRMRARSFRNQLDDLIQVSRFD